jgi:hypothetical protein
MKQPRILFICKNRDIPYSTTTNESKVDYSDAYCDKKSSGLLNSVKFVAEMLTKSRVECKIADVIDNNCIDREVTEFRPTHVIVEALWVVPSKFDILTKLHPSVHWIIRLHSEIPFLAGEGSAMGWLYDYCKFPQVSVACNSKRIANDLAFLLKSKVLYLPNYYDVKSTESKIVNPIPKDECTLDIGCFGAIRPLKNQLIQAIAAMEFATSKGKKLKFHINGSRVEGKGEGAVKNIRSLFDKNLHGHELVEHEWMNHEAFVGLIGQMDIVMQVSFTETYNIVTADAVAQNVPVVVSNEIAFVAPGFKASCTETPDIVRKLNKAYQFGRFGAYLNAYRLFRNAALAKKQWLKVFVPSKNAPVVTGSASGNARHTNRH